MTATRAGSGRCIAGREAAYLAVLDVLRGGGFAGDTLRALRSAEKLSGREAGLATQIALGAVRHMITIEHLLSALARFDPQRARRELRAILYAATCQIVWMDRVPVFAAVDEAVEQARRHVGRRSPGMVNAVLRQVTRALAERRVPWRRLDPQHLRVSWEHACAFSRDVLPPAEPPERVPAHLAAATGEREDRYRALVARFGPEVAEQIAWAAQAVPVTVLRRNPLRVGPDEFHAAMHALGGVGARPVACQDPADLTPDAAFLPPWMHLADLPVFVEGGAFVQDPTAHAAALLVAAQPGERILDLCAAPGGKSVALALKMHDQGEVVAYDVSTERLRLVQENAARLGLTCLRTSARLPGEPDDAPALGLFDAALVDVPCTNTGVIARRPEARLGFTADKLASLVRAQRELLRVAARHVRPGGRMVYSTCSLEPEENEQVVEWFLTERPHWRLETQQTTLPAWGPRLSDWRDGGYAARLVQGRAAGNGVRTAHLARRTRTR